MQPKVCSVLDLLARLFRPDRGHNEALADIAGGARRAASAIVRKAGFECVLSVLLCIMTFPLRPLPGSRQIKNISEKDREELRSFAHTSASSMNDGFLREAASSPAAPLLVEDPATSKQTKVVEVALAAPKAYQTHSKTMPDIARLVAESLQAAQKLLASVEAAPDDTLQRSYEQTAIARLHILQAWKVPVGDAIPDPLALRSGGVAAVAAEGVTKQAENQDEQQAAAAEGVTKEAESQDRQASGGHIALTLPAFARSPEHECHPWLADGTAFLWQRSPAHPIPPHPLPQHTHTHTTTTATAHHPHPIPPIHRPAPHVSNTQLGRNLHEGLRSLDGSAGQRRSYLLVACTRSVMIVYRSL